ncbi:hypothetical protein [Pseudomonas sp. BJa3]|uniref:hypothetical protein n=1 Tax=Pseudomonas sp. BJa3 TaxID=2986525 RepID=UPI002265F724|nr:hypothetical protein [Pseudomonas sp. BJa3]MCX5507686.1 hypothetical protein [Pseudomonas sp. BJa3]
MTDQDSPLLCGFVGKHQSLVDKHFVDEMDDHTGLLKVHLMLEQILRDFCTRAVPNPDHLQDARLSFKQIALLARSLDPNQSDVAPLWSAVNDLNAMRNAMAHELEPSESKFTKLQRTIIAAVDTHNGSSGEHDLGAALGYLCGMLSVHLHHGLDQRSQEGADPVE